MHVLEYLEKVIALFTSGKYSCTKEKTPTLVFVSGQTGCGKTQVIKILKNENNRLNVQELTSLKANSYNYLEKN